MRRVTSSPNLHLALLLSIGVASATNLQLTSVQPIAGFSQTCFTAYSQRLPSCSLDDLLASVGGKNGGCSISCISDLTAAQADVQGSCQGERAARQTVIGQMFLGNVVNFLCGDVGGDGAAQSSSQAAPSTIAAPTTTMSTAAPMDSSTASPPPQSTESSTTSSATESAAPSTTAEAPSSSGSQPSSSTTTTARATQSGNNASGADNSDGTGGGSPFDGGPGDFEGAATTTRLLSGRCHSYILAPLAATLLLLLR